MGRISLLDTMEETIFKFSNGNPGAMQALIELLNLSPEKMFQNLLTLDRMELYENKLYMLWNDSCDRNVEKMQDIIKAYRSGRIKKSDIDERIKKVGRGKKFDDLLEVRLLEDVLNVEDHWEIGQH